jgi:hypothetical protein
MTTKADRVGRMSHELVMCITVATQMEREVKKNTRPKFAEGVQPDHNPVQS